MLIRTKLVGDVSPQSRDGFIIAIDRINDRVVIHDGSNETTSFPLSDLETVTIISDGVS